MIVTVVERLASDLAMIKTPLYIKVFSTFGCTGILVLRGFIDL